MSITFDRWVRHDGGSATCNILIDGYEIGTMLTNRDAGSHKYYISLLDNKYNLVYSAESKAAAKIRAREYVAMKLEKEKDDD